MLTFLIPVRHPDSVSDWGIVRSLMGETLRSVAAQDHLEHLINGLRNITYGTVVVGECRKRTGFPFSNFQIR
jgi:hypothetical protein